ncbi:MAG: type II toxin-antitoxin system Phd/YefM family antitoxin [Candidatus Limnocylindria bacterium]
MALGISIRDFRDHLTDYSVRVERGEHLVVQRHGTSIVLLRTPEEGDRGRCISITRLRRSACRALRLAERRPLLVLWHCRRSMWMGPLPSEVTVEHGRPRRQPRGRAA